MMLFICVFHLYLAVIRPMSCEPHMKNIKKSDPVQRYQKYRQSWDMCRAPGERSHNQLRWDIREQMLHHDQVVTKVRNCLHLHIASFLKVAVLQPTGKVSNCSPFTINLVVRRLQWRNERQMGTTTSGTAIGVDSGG